MGRLIERATFGERRGRTDIQPLHNPFWYFKDSTRQRPLDFDIDLTYPHKMYVHWDDLEGVYQGEPSLEEAGELRIAIRKWLEFHVIADVIYERISKTYYRVYNMDKQGEANRFKTTIEHGYYVFYFDNVGDAFGFRCAFNQVKAEASANHPNFPPHENAQDFTDPWEARSASKGY